MGEVSLGSVGEEKRRRSCDSARRYAKLEEVHDLDEPAVDAMSENWRGCALVGVVYMLEQR